MSARKGDFEVSAVATVNGREIGAEVVIGIDPSPLVVHMLRVLVDRDSFAPEHVRKVEAVSRLVLKHWEHAENIEQLKTDLGLSASRKRRTSLPVRRQGAIVAAIIRAAREGNPDPKGAAREALQAETREVQRAWKTWKHLALPVLEWNASQSSGVQRERMLASIKRLR